MIAARPFALAQARLQARLGGLPGEGTWQALAASRTLGAFLEDARQTPIGPWLHGFSRLSHAHELELGLRMQYGETVALVAAWAPAPWRPALAWTRWLAYLPLIPALQPGAQAPSWVSDDRVLRAILEEDGGGGTEMGRDPSLAGVARGTAPEVAAAWWRAWRARWPRCGRAHGRSMAGLVGLLKAHGVGTLAERWPHGRDARRELRRRLHTQIHLWPLEPAALFAFLAVIALDLERLRGELVGRALFGPEPG